MVGVRHADSGVVLGYQVDELAHTCLVELSIAESHIYPRIMSKVPTLIHFLLELCCED